LCLGACNCAVALAHQACRVDFTTAFLATCRAQIDLASVEVRFQNLSIDADIAVGARGEPTVLNSYRNTLEVTTYVTVKPCSTRHLEQLTPLLVSSLCPFQCYGHFACHGPASLHDQIIFRQHFLCNVERFAKAAHHEAKQASFSHPG